MTLSKHVVFIVLGALMAPSAFSEKSPQAACDADGIPVACRIIGRGKQSAPDLCRRSVNKDVCFVDVQYSNGRRQRLLGDNCVSSRGDECVSGGNHALVPECSRYIDLD